MNANYSLQATLAGERALREAVQKITQNASHIADLYAGIGTFSLPLAAHASVHAVEGLAAPLAPLDAGWRRATGLQHVTTETRDLAQRPLMPDELNKFDAIVIDPPRSGAAEQARHIAVSDVSQIAFVACDPVSFARDARILADGGMEISRLWIVDQFRWSPHVETVAEFRRR